MISPALLSRVVDDEDVLRNSSVNELRQRVENMQRKLTSLNEKVSLLRTEAIEGAAEERVVITVAVTQRDGRTYEFASSRVVETSEDVGGEVGCVVGSLVVIIAIKTKQKKTGFRRLKHFYSCDSLALSLTNNECYSRGIKNGLVSSPSSLNNKTSAIIRMSVGVRITPTVSSSSQKTKSQFFTLNRSWPTRSKPSTRSIVFESHQIKNIFCVHNQNSMVRHGEDVLMCWTCLNPRNESPLRRRRRYVFLLHKSFTNPSLHKQQQNRESHQRIG